MGAQLFPLTSVTASGPVLGARMIDRKYCWRLGSTSVRANMIGGSRTKAGPARALISMTSTRSCSTARSSLTLTGVTCCRRTWNRSQHHSRDSGIPGTSRAGATVRQSRTRRGPGFDEVVRALKRVVPPHVEFRLVRRQRRLALCISTARPMGGTGAANARVERALLPARPPHQGRRFRRSTFGRPTVSVAPVWRRGKVC